MSQPLNVVAGDRHDERLVANVAPADWKNPEPAERYNLVVVGAGTGGLITAAVAAGIGARVALIERHMMGGDCLNVGCVPSKGMIRESRRAAESRSAAAIGLPGSKPEDSDFGAAMERMRERRARISDEDAAERYRDQLGVDVFIGDARFSGSDTIEVAGKTLRFKKAVIASGARAFHPPIEGLGDAGFLTNETVFTLTERPRRLGVIGAGPIGCELAQAFQRLGSQVTIFEAQSHLLTREDADAAEILVASLARDGVELVLGCKIQRVSRDQDPKVIHVSCQGGTQREIEVDEILVGAGRAPNVEGMNLEGVGVEYDARNGIKVNDNLQTTNKRIFAVGDCAMRWKFTHAADAAAKIVVRNALFGFLPKQKLSKLVMPWCTYTDPEIAHVGMYERDAKQAGIEIDTYKVPLEKVNRAVTDGEEDGFVKVHVKKGTDRILGATIVATHAGEMLSEITLAMVAGVGLGTILTVIHPYPTQAEAIKRAAGEHARSRLTPTVAKIFDRWMAWTR